MATYNRADTLRVSLEHLARQSLDPREYEVLVVDDGSSDATPGLVREVAPRLPFRLRYLRHENRGPGYTQNRGIREAGAPLVLLVADDIHLQPDALRAHLAVHERHPGPGVAVLGKVVQSPALGQTVFLRKWDPFRFAALEGARELPYYLFWACNISFKRGFMLEHGMFVEQMGRAGPAAHEDVELGCRLARHGLRVLYGAEALGHHYHLETLAGASGRAYQRGLNWEEFRRRSGEPELSVKYHVLNLRTLGDHLRVLFGPNQLRGAERSLAWHLFRQGVRLALFNRVSVPAFWIPVMERAERRPCLARLMHRELYRGVIFYHFLKGNREARRLYAGGGRAEGRAGRRQGASCA
jgi:glycosyltransferase involved in cell wall biosynthesis